MMWLAGVLIAAMALWITYDVVARYLFLAPTAWAMPFTEWALFAITFLGGAWLVLKDGHVRFELALDVMPQGMRRSCVVFASLLSAMVSLVLAFYSGRDTIDAYRRHILASTELDTPLWPILALMPLGSILLAICFLLVAMRQWSGAAEGGKVPR